MYIVYYKLGKEPCVKHFNVKHEAIDFAEMQDNDDGKVRILHMDPTNPQPISISFNAMLNKAGIKKSEPLVMPVIPRNEYELILEEALTKMYGLVKGLAEQLKRISQ